MRRALTWAAGGLAVMWCLAVLSVPAGAAIPPLTNVQAYLDGNSVVHKV